MSDAEGPSLQENPLLKAMQRLEQRVGMLEMERRVDQDLITCLITLVEKPAALQKVWQLGISGVAADSAVRWAALDDGVQNAARYLKDAADERIRFWAERIQLAVDLRQESDDTD